MRTSLVILSAALVGIAFGTEQSVAVKGQVLCHGKPYSGAKMFLMEKDLLDPEDEYDRTISNYTGYFELEGWENEIFDIDPYMRVEHTCTVKKERKLCVRSFTLDIPDAAVQRDRIIKNYFDFHKMELADARPGETEDCN